MTSVSRHEYTALLIDPEIPLPLSEASPGSVSLDASRVPYVEASVTIAVEDPELLELLDPRDNRRISLTATSTGGLIEETRTFNLGLRRSRPNRGESTVTLDLASDEALLADYAPLNIDYTPRLLSSSLRQVTNYVLGKIGASLEPGTLDADVTPYWSVTNLLLNPGAEASTANWSPAGNCSLFLASAPRSGANSCGFTSSAAGALALSPMLLSGKLSVSAGRDYVFSGWGRRYTNLPSGQLNAVIRWVDANGNSPWADVVSTNIPLNTTNFMRATVLGRAPVGAVAAFPFFHVTGATAAGQIGYIDDAMFHEGVEPVLSFDGSTPAGGGYNYAWAQDTNASTSTRTPVVERALEMLYWRAGTSGMQFLEPLLKAAGFRLVCNELREWTLRDADYRAEGNQVYRHAANIEQASEELSRDSGMWFDGAVYTYTWMDNAGIEQIRTDSYAIGANPTRVTRVDLDTPFPGPGRAQHIVERAQTRGRTITVTAIPTWREQTDQTLSVLLEGTPVQTGTAGSLIYNLSTDTITVTTRTADTPDWAWILIPAAERWIDSPVGESWTEEVI